MKVVPTQPRTSATAPVALGASMVPPGPGDSAGPCPLQLATPAGSVTVTGAGTRDTLAFTADGVLDLALIQPLFGEMFDEVRGTADLHAELSGAATAPAYAASLDLHDVGVRPAGQETVVQLPGGFVKVDNHSLGFSDVRVRVDDTYLNKQSELTLRGLVAHEHGVKSPSAGGASARWHALVSGRLTHTPTSRKTSPPISIRWGWSSG